MEAFEGGAFVELEQSLDAVQFTELGRSRPRPREAETQAKHSVQRVSVDAHVQEAHTYPVNKRGELYQQ